MENNIMKQDIVSVLESCLENGYRPFMSDIMEAILEISRLRKEVNTLYETLSRQGRYLPTSEQTTIRSELRVDISQERKA